MSQDVALSGMEATAPVGRLPASRALPAVGVPSVALATQPELSPRIRFPARGGYSRCVLALKSPVQVCFVNLPPTPAEMCVRSQGKHVEASQLPGLARAVSGVLVLTAAVLWPFSEGSLGLSCGCWSPGGHSFPEQSPCSWW